MPPPPQPSPPPPHHNLFKKPASFPDVIFAAFSLLALFSSPKPLSIFFLSNTNNKLSCPLFPRKFPKMTTSPNPRNPSRLPPPFATPQLLSDWLKPRIAADSFGLWGVKPGTKNIHNLWLEIAEGETYLADSLPPVRTVEVLVVKIIRNDGKILVESHQELSNGDVRHRGRPLSEKMKPGESVEAAVYRAVKEELGSILKIEKNVDDNGDEFCEIVKILPDSYTKKVEEGVSSSYPGLPACYVVHTVVAEVEGLPEEEFSTEEGDEYGPSNERDVADCAVSCRKHYWKWIDSDSV